MSDQSFEVAERRFREAGDAIFANQQQEPVYDWTVFYNSPKLKLRWDISGKSASEIERIAKGMAGIFGRMPQYRR